MWKNFLLYSINISRVDSECENGTDPAEDALDNVVRDTMVIELAEAMVNERVGNRLCCLVAEPVRAIKKVSKVDRRQIYSHNCGYEAASCVFLSCNYRSGYR